MDSFSFFKNDIKYINYEFERNLKVVLQYYLQQGDKAAREDNPNYKYI